MPWTPQLTTLRNRLAVLFPMLEDARTLVDEALLDAAHIAFDNKAINNWHSILTQAELRNKVEPLVLAALAHSENDAELRVAYQAYMTSIGKRASVLLPSSQPLTPATVPPQPLEKPIKILFLAANPRDMPALQLDEEIRVIDQRLRQAAFREQFELISHWAVRFSDLQELLLRHQPTILHFSGHGVEGDQLMVLNDQGNSHPISTRSLEGLFAVLKDNVRCVVLNACYSQLQAEAIAKQIDVVIGMSGAITDKASYHFAAAFYQGLAYGRSVQTAFDLGCLQIDLANLNEQDQPQLIAVRSNPTQITIARASTPNSTTPTTSGNTYHVQVNTGGGQYIAGNVDTGGGDFVGRDKLSGGVQPKQDKEDIKNGVHELLTQHQRNLLKLQQQKAIYGAGEVPLHLLNQIEHEEQEITRLKRQLW